MLPQRDLWLNYARNYSFIDMRGEDPGSLSIDITHKEPIVAGPFDGDFFSLLNCQVTRRIVLNYGCFLPIFREQFDRDPNLPCRLLPCTISSPEILGHHSRPLP